LGTDHLDLDLDHGEHYKGLWVEMEFGTKSSSHPYNHLSGETIIT
jgi:hypothetical protein